MCTGTRAAARVRQLFETLARTVREGGYGAALLERAQFLELMVEVNRVCLGGHQVQATAGDSKVVALLQYLNLHLTGGAVHRPAGGAVLHQQVPHDAAVPAGDGLLHPRLPDGKAAAVGPALAGAGCVAVGGGEQTGYQDYSTFSRAYKKHFGRGPSADMVRKHDLQ